MPKKGIPSTATEIVVIPQAQQMRNMNYTPEQDDVVIALGRAGIFPEEWASHLGITERKLRSWRTKNANFDLACEMAWTHCSAWWTNKVRENLDNPRLRQTLLTKVLRTRFPHIWSQEIVTNPHLNPFQNLNEANLDHVASVIEDGMTADAGLEDVEAAMLEDQELNDEIARLLAPPDEDLVSK